MENISKEEVEDFIKNYERIVGVVRDGIENKSVREEKFIDTIGKSEYSEEFIKKISSEEIFKKWYELLKAQENHNSDLLLMKLKRNRRKKMQKRIAAFAGGIAAAFLAVVFLVVKENPVRPDTENAKVAEVKSSEMMITKPTLILSSDRVITLDNKDNKLDVSDFSAQEGSEVNSTEERHLLIPKGYTYTIILDDSSEVFLNAGSELWYPSDFRGDIREVTLRGEAYFNVKKSSKPFIVKTDNASVKVYGTSFNVDAKSKDELRTLLVEGSIGIITKEMKEIKLVPNQMGILDYETHKYRVQEVVPEHYLGWMDGYFRIVNAPLDRLFSDIANWYGLDISYDKTLMKKLLLTVSIKRDYPLDKMINFIENSAKVKFIKEGGTKYLIEKF